MLKKEYGSLEEVLKEVKATGGLDLSIEFICHVQDLIGHSAYDALIDLSREYKETFYRVFCEAEGTTEALKFFFDHSNAVNNIREKLSEAQADAEKWESLYNDLHEIHDKSQIDLSNRIAELKGELFEAQTATDALTLENERLTAEITRLKVKLYDMMEEKNA